MAVVVKEETMEDLKSRARQVASIEIGCTEEEFKQIDVFLIHGRVFISYEKTHEMVKAAVSKYKPQE
jgi:hypothetical protein